MIAHDEKVRDSVARDVLLILLLAAVLFLPALWTRDLWSPDEPRYMAVGWGMAQTGDYLVPRLSGYLYPDKPPLFFWLAAFLYRVGLGLNSGRVVAALAAVGTVLVTYFLAQRRMGGRAGLMAASVTLTLAFFLATAKTGVIDPLVTFLIVSTIACGLRAMEPKTQAARRWWLAAYALGGLAVLTKGPVGMAVPLLVLMTYGLAMRGKIKGGGWAHLPGVLLMLNIVGWWLIPALVSGGDAYAKEIVFSQTSKRLVHSTSHQGPFYHYLLILPGILIPWTLLFVPAAWSAWLAWRREREPVAVLGLAWFFSIFLFFSIISGKRMGYILPLAPAAGLLLARYLMMAEDGRLAWPRLHRALTGITLAAIAVAAVLMFAGAMVSVPVTGTLFPKHPELKDEVARLARGLALVLALPMALMLALVVFSWRRAMARPWALVSVLIGLMLIASLTLDLAVLPRGNYFKSGKNFVEAVRADLATADRVYLFKSDFSGVYNIYTGRVAIPVLRANSSELRNALVGPERVAVIGRDTDLYKELGKPLPLGRIAEQVRVGHRVMLLVVNWSEAAPVQAPGSSPRQL